jgi:NAD(P)-dependent dehydrogenase (short-subunit alcohol dehydrogenase family)
MTHQNQRVLITAAGSGIGRATAEAFLAAGAKVYICDVDKAALESALEANKGLAGSMADVSDEAAVDRLFEAALAHLGGLDVMVSNAGIAGPTALVEDIALEDWRRCLAVNLDGAFLCARRAAPIFKRQKSGVIVNLSSTAGLFGFPRRSPYCSAKWAIRGFTKTLAQELGPYGIRANCICPGAVEGPRIDRVIAAEAEKSGRTFEDVKTQYASQSSLKTFIKAADIANTILFLCSEAGARISGQEIAVDGHTETL